MEGELEGTGEGGVRTDRNGSEKEGMEGRVHQGLDHTPYSEKYPVLQSQVTLVVDILHLSSQTQK